LRAVRILPGTLNIIIITDFSVPRTGHNFKALDGARDIVKGTKLANNIYVLRDDSTLRGTKECLIKSFAFYYNNIY